MDSYNLGTIELIPVDVTDKIGTITDLTSYIVEYKIMDESELTTHLDWTAVNSISGMRVFALLDTTVGTWNEGTYKLYVRPTVGPERPILGPMLFGLS